MYEEEDRLPQAEWVGGAPGWVQEAWVHIRGHQALGHLGYVLSFPWVVRSHGMRLGLSPGWGQGEKAAPFHGPLWMGVCLKHLQCSTEEAQSW